MRGGLHIDRLTRTVPGTSYDGVMWWQFRRSSNQQVLVLRLARTVQDLVDLRFAALEGSPEPGSALDQLGLDNGLAVVTEYVEVSELGLAFDHLIYMVDELSLELTRQDELSFHYLAHALGVPPPKTITKPQNL